MYVLAIYVMYVLATYVCICMVRCKKGMLRDVHSYAVN